MSLDHSRCYLCGPEGLQAEFNSHDEITESHFLLEPGMESLTGIGHGGLLTALMDEAMARWLYDRKVLAVTALLSVKFRNAACPGQMLHIIAENQEIRGGRYKMQARIVSESGDEVASAEAVFCRLKGKTRKESH